MRGFSIGALLVGPRVEAVLVGATQADQPIFFAVVAGPTERCILQRAGGGSHPHQDQIITPPPPPPLARATS